MTSAPSNFGLLSSSHLTIVYPSLPLLTREDIIELKKLVKFQEGILEFGSDIKEFFYLDNQFHATKVIEQHSQIIEALEKKTNDYLIK